MLRFLLLSIFTICFFACNGQIGENIVGTSILHKCHNNNNGTLTSFIVVQGVEIGNANPVILGRFTADDAPYTPPAGKISFGTCTTDNNCLVQNLPDHDDVIGTMKNYPANSFHTLTFTVTEGTAVVTVNGKPTTYQKTFTEKYEAPNDCSFVDGSLLIEAYNGAVKVAIIR